ncbi:MAG: flagellin lysine-N-methylase [Clostridia bacterium]|nr:flagellin lysine-N-methylase [Clostridia bacterium]
MNTYVPSYYNKFKCIADKCSHNCCIGWEICIDDDALAKYKKLDREANTEILKNIEFDGEGAHFSLRDGGRCPNLQDDNLCRLICRHGEDVLCEICREHPRFRNCFNSFEEFGLGLSCEEAARIILSYPEKVTFEVHTEEKVINDDREHILRDRYEALSHIQNRSLSINERLEKLDEHIPSKLPYSETEYWCDFFLSLERLDEKWTEVLNEIKSLNVKTLLEAPCYKNELAAEQLLTYFICRHYRYEDGESNISEVCSFARLSCDVIFNAATVLFKNHDSFFDALCDAARMYSSEIEYSPDNTAELLFEVSF